MNCVWKQVFLCGVFLSLVFNAGYCGRPCQTLDDCFGSTEFSQFHHKRNLDPYSPKYDPSNICEKSNPVKEWCYNKNIFIFQEDEICGQVISDESFIGPKTRINEFPWMALLQYTDGKTIETFCHGVLVTNEVVMTAGSCLKRNTNGYNLTSVRLGEWDKTTVVDCDNSSGVSICNDPPVVVPIKSAGVGYYNFSSTSHHYNVGIIRLKHKIEFTYFIKPICLPFLLFYPVKREFYVGRKFEIASWGETSPGGKKSEILLKVDLEAVDLKDGCPSDLHSDLCIPSTRKRNVCAGDEGAPIMGRTRKGNRTFVFLAGIVSHSNSCDANEGPIFLATDVDWRN